MPEPSAKASGKRRQLSEPTSEGPAPKRSRPLPESDDSDVEVLAVSNQPAHDLTPFYAISCPICLSQPQSMVVTRCGHAYCGACLFAALSTPNDKEALYAQGGLGPSQRIKIAESGGLPTGHCPVCRTVRCLPSGHKAGLKPALQKLVGDWGRAARGIMWKTKRRRKASAARRKVERKPSTASSDDVQLLSPKDRPDSDIEILPSPTKPTKSAVVDDASSHPPASGPSGPSLAMLDELD